jgi:hypothetical protein
MGKPVDLRLSEHFGMMVSSGGIAPYINSPAGKIHAGIMSLPSPVKGMNFTFGKKTAPVFMKLANMMVADKLKTLAPPQKPPTRGPKTLRPHAKFGVRQ